MHTDNYPVKPGVNVTMRRVGDNFFVGDEFVVSVFTLKTPHCCRRQFLSRRDISNMFHIEAKLSGTNRVVSLRVCMYTLVGDRLSAS